jgi:hypothetical protein
MLKTKWATTAEQRAVAWALTTVQADWPDDVRT